MANKSVKLSKRGVEYVGRQILYNPDNLPLEQLVGKDLGNDEYELPIAFWSSPRSEWRFVWILLPYEITSV